MNSQEFSAVGSNQIKGVRPRVLDGIARWSLYALFLLVPLYFLPWTSEAFEINKQTLFVIVCGIGFASWLCSMVISRHLNFRIGISVWLPALFLGAVFLSSILSMSGYQTWVGHASQEYTSFLSIAMFVLLFYLILHRADRMKIQQNLLFTLFLSGAIASIISLFYVFGVHIIPGVTANGFNTVGTINSYVLFATVLMHVGLAMWLVSKHGAHSILHSGLMGILTKVFIVIIGIVALLIALAIDFWLFWALNIIGVLLLVVFALLSTKSFPKPKRFIIPLLILLMSVIFLFFSSFVKLQIPLVVSPSYGSSWDITRQTITQGTQELLFGTGPGTFMYDYAKYKPVEVNQTMFWNTRFDRAKSHIVTMFSTLGLFGVLTWLAFSVYLLVASLGKFLKGKDPDELKMSYALFVGWFLLFFSFIFYSSNFTLQFAFWGFSGMLAAHFAGRAVKTDFATAPKLSLFSTFVFVALGIGILTAIFVSGQRYVADLAFTKAVRLSSASADHNLIVEQLDKAVRYNKLSDLYSRQLGLARLGQAGLVLQTVGTNEPTQEQLQQLSELVKAGVEASTKAASLAPQDSNNWAVLGAVYRDLMPFVTGAESIAAQTITKAIELEPKNPAHFVSLARVYLALSERAAGLMESDDAELAKTAKDARVTNLAEAEKMFGQAITLKPDYATAHYYLAATYERQGRIADAVTRIEALRDANPLDIGLGFQLGILYLNAKDVEKAKVEFERLLGLQPDYANAMWYLSAIYEQEGDSAKALELVQKVAEGNPDNAVVQERLSKMQKGHELVPVPVPVEPNQETVTELEVTQ
ncbi:MAG: tetratricopeptide repeat protein [Patescibacteria group bacterium]